MNNKGRVGCGCLIFILVVCMVGAGIFMHPITLKFIANQFSYEDKIFQSDVIFVPRFLEDKNGEIYIATFREFWSGNGKAIWVEDDKLLEMSISEMVLKMAKERGIKDGVIKKVEIDGEGKTKAGKTKEYIKKTGVKKVIVMVPEYASRRFHMSFGSTENDGKVLFLIKSVSVSYFKKDKWWKEPVSRDIILKELFLIGSYYLDKFKYSIKER